MRQDVANSVLQYNTNKGILRVYPYYYLVIRAMLNYTKSIPLLQFSNRSDALITK